MRRGSSRSTAVASAAIVVVDAGTSYPPIGPAAW